MINKPFRRVRVVPYKPASKGAKEIAYALGGLRLKAENSTFRPRDDDLIINWGNTNCPYPQALNANIRDAQDKLKFFTMMKETGHETLIPRFWENKEDIPSDRQFDVVARSTLTGHSGIGISIHSPSDDLPQCPLYVEYIKKEDEYRVHVGINPRLRGDDFDEQSITIIGVQQKKRRREHENPNWQVRNHANGFIFARMDVSAPPSVLAAAKTALAASGLDFGAVDVIYNKKTQRPYVLEINTAPGLEGTTVEEYKEFFKNV